ncbi:MAG TPA: hypothetical protein VMB26_10790 [Candidatus Binataceae bacterium]|nr:hypothetical protein [Candidatus Binataceae bacterium]
MKKWLQLLACLAAIFVTNHGAFAQQSPPPTVPRSAIIARPSAQVFDSLKHYFADTLTHHFKLISANPATGVIVAKRSGIDENTWGNLAFCKTQSVNMLDTLNEGAVTVTVTVKAETPKATRVTISPDFKGYYSLGNAQDVISCQSKGALEDQILASAGLVAPAPL